MASISTSACRGLAVLMIVFLLGACTSGSSPSTAPVVAPATEGTTEQVGEPSGSAPDTSIAAPEMVFYPQEYAAYQQYLDVIKGRPSMADAAVIEGTVLSIQPGEVCPYQQEPCPMDPYPDDWGTVRVDKIVEYAPLGEEGQNPEEAQGGETQAGGAQPFEGQTSPGYAGAGGQPSPIKYSPLQSGQELMAHFLLTARPARVRQLTTTASEGAGPAQPLESGAGQVVTHQAEPGDATFEPVPREGDYFVFSTLATGAQGPADLLLPGLTAGSRFRARVLYDGTLYVEEYELIR